MFVFEGYIVHEWERAGQGCRVGGAGGRCRRHVPDATNGSRRLFGGRRLTSPEGRGMRQKTSEASGTCTARRS